jgi:hypothetical protein
VLLFVPSFILFVVTNKLCYLFQATSCRTLAYSAVSPGGQSARRDSAEGLHDTLPVRLLPWTSCPRSVWVTLFLRACTRGLCSGVLKGRAVELILLGCHILLQLWCHERFAIGRPVVALYAYEPLPEGHDPERTLLSPRGGVNRRDDQIKPFSPTHLS